MEGKTRISGAKAGNEVVFEGADGSFSGIAAMHARGSKLEVNVFGM